MIELRNVIKRYGAKRAVDDVSFSVKPGESLALWGSDGAGKTTLLRCLLGVTIFDGSITVDGLSSSRNGKQVRGRIGYVPQSVPTFDMSVGDMMVMVARLRQADLRDGMRRIEEFELAHTTGQPVSSLFGGMERKLALTLALLGEPPVLLLDEPTANLDARSQAELVALLVDLKRQGRTIVFTSHRWSEVRALADRVVRLDAGRQVGMSPVTPVERGVGTVTLRVPLPAEVLDHAVSHLQENGFIAGRNGHAVLITVDAKRKAEPLLLLARSHYDVADFNVEDDR